MYGKHTYTEIAAEIGRSQGGIYRVVKLLKERGVI
jgi:predicted transcriptional regulator